MTREEMVKIRFKAYMTIDYKDHGMKHSAECLLSSIDFDSEILKLTPLNDFYEQNEFWGHIQFCSISKKLRPVAINGNKIKDRTENTLKEKKIGVYIEDEQDDHLDDAS